MNVETGEIKPWSRMTDAEKASGKFIPLTELPQPGKLTLAELFNPSSGLPWDAKPQAHRRAISARRAVEEIMRHPISAGRPPTVIVGPDDLVESERLQLLGIATP